MNEANMNEGAGNGQKAVVLLSGGLDSATCLAIAKNRGFACYGLSFDYGQRHGVELEAARALAHAMGVAEHRILALDMPGIAGSALTDPAIPVPEQESAGIPVTYVPARNTLFLAHALAWAEVLEAEAIFIGVNALDYSGYPDCRPAFIRAFQKVADLATRLAVEGRPIAIETPLLRLSKKEIIALGNSLGVDYGLTISCYQPDAEGRACGRCDSCRFRKKGFLEAGVEDPAHRRE